MKYPYIGESTVTERKVLFTLPGVGFDFSRVKMKGGFDESIFKNITAEYLANTYGEVKSKEHAEFIVKLADVNGVVIFKDSEATRPKDIKYFSVTSDGILYFWNDKAGIQYDRKQITIPLPPECEKPSAGGCGQSMDYNNCRCGTAPVLNDEWPKVGEIVLTASKSKAKVLAVHNKKAWVEYVSGANGFNTLNIASLSKQKTPEQELRDDIIKTIHDDVYKGAYRKESFEIFADALMAKYNITKKGEGDE